MNIWQLPIISKAAAIASEIFIKNGKRHLG
jgi:hypothetical protein